MGTGTYSYKTGGGLSNYLENSYDEFVNPSNYKADLSVYNPGNNNLFKDSTKFDPSINGNDIGAGSGGLGGLGNIFGGVDGKIMGMDSGEFGLGLGQLALGYMGYKDNKEFNDVQMDAMKSNIAMTEKQFANWEKFNADTAAAWA